MSENPEQEEQIAFLPFHAINDFMNDGYRLAVVRAVITSLPRLPEDLRHPIDQMIKQSVTVPGFRNSAKAPAPVKVRPVAEAFVKYPQLVAAVIAAWAELNAGLRQQVYDLLVSREWDILPPEADRTQLPGFYPEWPAEEDFDTLNAAFKERYPDSQASSDDISLMCVWMSACLPYHLNAEDDQDQEYKD